MEAHEQEQQQSARTLDPAIATPSLPKGGGAIQSIGKGWGAVGNNGAASLEIALPISPGRGYAPPLSLSYQSTTGNGLFG
ncbi:SpvB/TcaC N-terminal domain-containing protein, partial [Pseudomonas viridiflava]